MSTGVVLDVHHVDQVDVSECVSTVDLNGWDDVVDHTGHTDRHHTVWGVSEPVCGKQRGTDRVGTVHTQDPVMTLGTCRTVQLNLLPRVVRTRFESVSAVVGVSKDRPFHCGIPRTLSFTILIIPVYGGNGLCQIPTTGLY